MPRRAKRSDPEGIRHRLVDLLLNFEQELKAGDLRAKVLALVPAHHLLRDLGSSLIPNQDAEAAQERILFYFQRYPLTVLRGEELTVVSGINEWPRRVRELRVEHGWAIVSGVTAKAMESEEDFSIDGVDISGMRTDDYILVDKNQDREMAYRWNVANQIRRRRASVKDKILEYVKQNVGKPVTGEELRYVAKNRTEWARRVRELRTEMGWPVATRNTGRPDLKVGTYVLEQDRQSPAHDRTIPDPVRRAVLRRDGYKCGKCGWNHELWNPSDPRHLELHHVKPHVEHGENTEDNLVTLCTVCHDGIHRSK